MERAVEGLVAVSLFGVGLSHVLQPLAWVEFFVWLRSQGRCAVFLEGLLRLNFGALVVAFHNVWTGPAAVVTVLGWGMVAKGTLRLAAPGLGLQIDERISPERAWHFRVAGGLGPRPQRVRCLPGVVGLIEGGVGSLPAGREGAALGRYTSGNGPAGAPLNLSLRRV